MTRDPQVAAVIERNMPMIRNNLVLIFAARSSDDLDTVEGKEAFREEARARYSRSGCQRRWRGRSRSGVLYQLRHAVALALSIISYRDPQRGY